MRYPAAIPAAALLAGTATALLIDVVLPSGRMTAAALLLAALTVVWAAVTGRIAFLAVSVAALFFIGGALIAAAEWQRAWRPPLRATFDGLTHQERSDAAAVGRRLPLDDEASAVLEGVLRSDATATETGVSLSLAVERMTGFAADARERESRTQETSDGREREGRRQATSDWPEREGFSRASSVGGVLLTVVGDLARNRMGEWRAGRRVRLPARLHRAQRYLDPGVPDAERALARRGTSLVGTGKSGALVAVLARGAWWEEALASARHFARAAVDDAVGRWSRRSAAIVAAIVIGDRSQLDADVQRRLQDAGTYHVVAISGGNIAILAGVLLRAFRVAGWFGRSGALAVIAVLVVYARLVGGGASVDRATLMALVYFGGRVFDHRSPPLNGLIVVAALLVAADPLSVVDPAFLLTCGATLAILVAAPLVDPRASGWLRAAAQIAAASAAAEIVLLPVGAALFSRVTFAGLALNLLAIPLMAVAQIAGMLVVPAALVSRWLAAAAGWIAHAGAAGLIWSADLVRFAPMVTWRVAPPSPITCVVYYAGLGLAFIAWRRRSMWPGRSPLSGPLWGRLAATAWLAAAAWILWPPSSFFPARGDGRLHLTFLDVGQGDSIFVVFPQGSTLLVDAGGLGFSSAFDVGDRVVAPVIRAAGFRAIDRLALTHGDPDHIGGARAVLREFRPAEVWEGIPVPRSAGLAALRLEAQALGARWANVFAGDAVRIDGVDVIARHPRPPEWERQKVRNDDSLVLELRWRDVSVLLTGDIGQEAETPLAASLRGAPFRIVKVPHHGSRTSSTSRFVEALRPRLAVVSAGRANHFGHPVPEVLARYEAVGAEIFRTDRDGAVLVTTDGRSVSVESYNGNTKSLK